MSERRPKPPEFYDRAHASRERIAATHELEGSEGKYEWLKDKGLELYRGAVPDLRATNSPIEFGMRIDQLVQEIRELFPEDDYGIRAASAAKERIIEKLVDEVGDWLTGEGEEGLLDELKEAATNWRSLQQAGAWINERVLSGRPKKQTLFEQAKESVLVEFEAYATNKQEHSQ